MLQVSVLQCGCGISVECCVLNYKNSSYKCMGLCDRVAGHPDVAQKQIEPKSMEQTCYTVKKKKERESKGQLRFVVTSIPH